MIRLMHILAITALVSSATYAYTIKYDTIFMAEKVAKLKHQVREQKEAINLLRAEWARLIRPERIEVLADKHLDLQQMQMSQIVPFSALPDRKPQVDEIGRKLEAMGLAAPTTTPSQPGDGAHTPSSQTQ